MPDFPAGITVTGVTCDEVTASGRPVSKSLRSNLAPLGSSVIEKEAFGSNVPLLVAEGVTRNSEDVAIFMPSSSASWIPCAAPVSGVKVN